MNHFTNFTKHHAGATMFVLTVFALYIFTLSLGVGADVQLVPVEVEPVLITEDTVGNFNVSITSEAPGSPLTHVTGFSSVECHSAWCNAHRGEGRTYVVAVAKWIHEKYAPTTMYLPKYDRTYEVLPPQYHATGTSIDMWFGDDREAALEFGSQYLEAQFNQ